MDVTGGCFCEHIRYRATIDPSQVIICHCTDCQRNSGTAYGTVVGVVDQDFELLTGTLKTFNKVADSGNIRALAFCPECGTRIHASTVGEGNPFIGLRTGTIDQRRMLTPTMQAWSGSALDWVQDIRTIPPKS